MYEGKFKGKYRIASSRASWWDYRQAAAYFVTMVTRNRVCYFGDIKDGVMDLSRVGVIADILWDEIKNHTNNVQLDAFTVMPNHLHGILILQATAVAVETGFRC